MKLKISAVKSSWLSWYFLMLALISLLFIFDSCEKDITIELPEQEPVLVVEGRIENGQPPYVILTKSTGYFEAADINSFLNSFVHDAIVTVESDNIIYSLPELCTSDLPPELRPLAAQFLGIRPDILTSNDYCIYTLPLEDLISGNFLVGVPGKSYRLKIESGSKSYSSITKVPELVPLDSVWFRTDGVDTVYGFAWARLTDPDTVGNAYRWFAKRISHGSYGQVKDENFIPPFSSIFDDKFINGQRFEFWYDRGNRPSEEGGDLPGEKQHYYKVGDTIVIKFCSIEKNVMNYIRKYETEIWNNGNPFASPNSLPTNISGNALGLWAGYGASYDTIIALQ